MDSKPIPVLVLGPQPQDYAAVKYVQQSTQEYEFHFLQPSQPLTYSHSLPSKKFAESLDYVGFLEEAVQYVRDNGIRAVVFSYDNMALIGAALCQETGLRGPSFESEFLCLHKYYSRKTEPSRLWCECISITDFPTKQQLSALKYPCFIKPATLTSSLGVAKLASVSDLEKQLSLYHESGIPSLVNAMYPLFNRYLDQFVYPLSNTPVAVVEEFVEDYGKYHCYEGWTDGKGDIHQWEIYDSACLTLNDEKLIGFFIPSLETKESISLIKGSVRKAVKNHKLNNVFFNVDLWKRGDRVDIIEINGRCTPSMIGIYHMLYSSSIYKAMVHLACGQYDKCEEESPDLKPTSQLKCGRFRWCTRKEGVASELLDFSKANNIGETEEIFDVMGHRVKGIRLSVEQNDYVLPGTQLGAFVLLGTDRLVLWERAKLIMNNCTKANLNDFKTA